MENEGFWRWLLRSIQPLFKFHWIKIIKSPEIEITMGGLVILLGTLLVCLQFRLYWAIPISVVGGFLLAAHGIWRGKKIW